MKQPDYMQEGTLVESKEDPVKRRDIPGVSFFKNNDGILYYYDQPLMFVAYIGEQLVIVTLLEQEFNYPEKPPRGWEQWIAFPVEKELMLKIARSQRPIRELWEQPTKENFFIHQDWTKTGENTWDQTYKMFKNVPVQEDWKPYPDTYLSVKGKKEEL